MGPSEVERILLRIQAEGAKGSEVDIRNLSKAVGVLNAELAKTVRLTQQLGPGIQRVSFLTSKGGRLVQDPGSVVTYDVAKQEAAKWATLSAQAMAREERLMYSATAMRHAPQYMQPLPPMRATAQERLRWLERQRLEFGVGAPPSPTVVSALAARHLQAMEYTGAMERGVGAPGQEELMGRMRERVAALRAGGVRYAPRHPLSLGMAEAVGGRGLEVGFGNIGGALDRVSTRARVAADNLGLLSRNTQGFGTILGKVTTWLAATGVVFGTLRAIRHGIRSYTNYEQQLADMQRVANFGRTGVAEVGQGILGLNQRYGYGLEETMPAATVFARTGMTSQETVRATRSAMAVSKLGGGTTENAALALTALMQQFDISKDVLPRIVDGLVKVDQQSRVTMKDLMDVMSLTGGIWAQAGGKVEELTGLTAAISERTGRPGSVIGNALKMFVSRMITPQHQQELYDITARAGKPLNVISATGEMMPPMQILRELRERWGGMTEEQRKAVTPPELLAMAGARQINILNAALEGFADASRMATDAANASGEAQASLAIKTDTITEAWKRLSASYQTMEVRLGAAGAPTARGAVEAADYALQQLSVGNIGYAQYPARASVWLMEKLGLPYAEHFRWGQDVNPYLLEQQQETVAADLEARRRREREKEETLRFNLRLGPQDRLPSWIIENQELRWRLEQKKLPFPEKQTQAVPTPWTSDPIGWTKRLKESVALATRGRGGGVVSARSRLRALESARQQLATANLQISSASELRESIDRQQAEAMADLKAAEEAQTREGAAGFYAIQGTRYSLAGTQALRGFREEYRGAFAPYMEAHMRRAEISRREGPMDEVSLEEHRRELSQATIALEQQRLSLNVRLLDVLKQQTEQHNRMLAGLSTEDLMRAKLLGQAIRAGTMGPLTEAQMFSLPEFMRHDIMRLAPGLVPSMNVMPTAGVVPPLGGFDMPPIRVDGLDADAFQHLNEAADKIKGIADEALRWMGKPGAPVPAEER